MPVNCEGYMMKYKSSTCNKRFLEITGERIQHHLPNSDGVAPPESQSNPALSSLLYATLTRMEAVCEKMRDFSKLSNLQAVLCVCVCAHTQFVYVCQCVLVVCVCVYMSACVCITDARICVHVHMSFKCMCACIFSHVCVRVSV